MKDEMTQVILRYFHEEGGQVAIYDANNTTIVERQYLRDFCNANNMWVTSNDKGAAMLTS